MKKSLKTKLIVIFFLVSIIPLLLLGIVSYNIMSNNMLREYDKRVSQQVIAGVENYDEWFGELESIVFSINTNQYTQKHLQKDEMKENYYDHILILTSRIDSLISIGSNKVDTFMLLPMNQDGYPIFRGDYILGNQSDYKKIPIVQEALESKNSLVWSVMMDSSNKKSYIVAAQAVFEQFSEEVIGVTVVGFNNKQLGTIAEEMVVNENEYIFVLDENNDVLYETQEGITQRFFTEDIQRKAELGEKEESFEVVSQREKYRLFVSSTRINGMKICYAMPEKNMLGPIDQLPRIVIIVLAVCFLFVTALAFYVYGDVYGPIKELSYAMNKFNKDTQYIQVGIKREDELGVLADCFNILISRIEDLIIEVEEEAKLKKDFEIRALQAQITPHFLYNTLNSIKAMARLGQTEDISSMTTALIRLLYVSASQGTDFITLEEEIKYLDAYIQIMQYRFEQPLLLEFNMKKEVMGSYILRFLLQPIVENSVLHGFREVKNRECKIGVKGSRDKNHLVIEITDNGEGMPSNMEELMNHYNEEKRRFSRIGIKNIEERIKMNFGEEYGLNYTSKLGEGTKVTVTLPFLDKLMH